MVKTQFWFTSYVPTSTKICVNAFMLSFCGIYAASDAASVSPLQFKHGIRLLQDKDHINPVRIVTELNEYLKKFTLSCSNSKFSIKDRNNDEVEQKHSCQLSNIYISIYIRRHNLPKNA